MPLWSATIRKQTTCITPAIELCNYLVIVNKLRLPLQFISRQYVDVLKRPSP